MSIVATLSTGGSIVETPTLGLDSGTDPAITRATTVARKLTGTSVPAVSKHVLLTDNLSSGTATIDLTSMTEGVLTKDFTDLKVQWCYIEADEDNTAAIVCADGATTGYNLFGDASGQVTLAAGCSCELYMPETLPDVSASLKNIDLTSSDVDAAYTIHMVAG